MGSETSYTPLLSVMVSVAQGSTLALSYAQVITRTPGVRCVYTDTLDVIPKTYPEDVKGEVLFLLPYLDAYSDELVALILRYNILRELC